MIRWLSVLASAAMAGLAVPAAAQVGGVPQPVHSCQRECLESYVDRYLQAMADGVVSDPVGDADAQLLELAMPLVA